MTTKLKEKIVTLSRNKKVEKVLYNIAGFV